MTDYTIEERFPQLYAEAVEAVYNWLKYEDYEDYYCDLHNFIFNMGFYEGVYEIATIDDVFAGIEMAINYQMEQFGKICSVGGLNNLCTESGLTEYLWYMAGGEVIDLLFAISPTFEDNWSDEATPENNEKICKDLEKEMAEPYIKDYL